MAVTFVDGACPRATSSCNGSERRTTRLRRLATLLPLTLCGVQPAVAEKRWNAKVTEPIPFSKSHSGGHNSVGQAEHEARYAKAKLRERELAEIEARLAAEEANLTAVFHEQREAAMQLEWKRHAVLCQQQAWLQNWAAQETSLLHLTVFRLVRFGAAAAGIFRQTGEDAQPEKCTRVNQTRCGVDAVKDDVQADSPLHERWSRVEIVTCMPGSMKVAAGDFPVKKIFHGSSPFWLTNICEESEDSSILDMAAMLKALRVYLNYAVHAMMGPIPVLIYVVLGTHIFFNEFLDSAGSDGASVVRRAGRHIIDRYEAAVAESVVRDDFRPVVVATDVLCHGCTKEEARRPFLRPGGLAGSAEGLLTILHGALGDGTADASRDGQVDPVHGFRQLDFLMNVGWLVPDHKQLLFGSFDEAVPGPCSEARRSHTSFCTSSAFGTASADLSSDDRHLCCPVGSDLDLLHKAYYPRYSVQGCTFRRFGDLPVTFHGDGSGKWLYMLALHDLASNCHRVARLVLHSHPVDMLDHVFQLFSATQQPGSAQPIAWR